MALGLGHEGIECLLEGREPQAVVDQLGPAGLDAALLVCHVALQGQVLQVRVRHQQGQRPRALVDLPAFDPHPAVLHHVDATPAIGADDRRDLSDELIEGEWALVQGDGKPIFEAYGHLHRVDRRGGGQLEDLLGWL